MVDAFNSAFMKKEVTYGVEVQMSPAENAVLMRNFSMKPIETDSIERNLDKPARGASPVVLTNPRNSFSYELELAGSGAAGTAPAWMEHLQACGMEAPLLTATVDARQRFAAIGAALSSLTAHTLRGNQRRRSAGCRGDITAIDFTAGAFPFVGLSMMGLLSASPFEQQGVPEVPLFSRWKDPVEVSTANTAFSLDGFPAVLRSLKLQANAEVKPRSLVGAKYIQRGNHKMTGKAMIEAPEVTSKNYFTTLLTNQKIALQIVHGTVAGNIVQVTAANAQIIGISDAEEDDVAMYDIDIQLNIVGGQDDILLVAK